MSDMVHYNAEINATRETALKYLPDTFRQVLENIDEDIRSLNEFQLEDHFDRGPIDFHLRKRLWELVAQAELTRKTIVIEAWLRGICESATLYSRVLKNPFRVCWIFIPFEDHKVKYEELFHILFSKFHKKIEKMDINDDNFGAAMKMLENLASRAYGAVPKNINLKAAHIHASTKSSTTLLPSNTKDLDEEIKKLEEKKISEGSFIDVEPE